MDFSLALNMTLVYYGTSKMKIRKGFTLIELIMVLVIAAILAIAVIPRTQAGSRVKLEAVCQYIASDLRYIQEMAMAQQVRFGISFTPGAETYFGYRVNISTKAKDPQTRGNLDVNLNQMSQFKGIDIVSTNFSDKIEFDSNGAPYDEDGDILSSHGVITIQTVDALYSRTVRIEPETGKVSVQ